jgi:hypothetical protein
MQNCLPMIRVGCVRRYSAVLSLEWPWRHPPQDQLGAGLADGEGAHGPFNGKDGAVHGAGSSELLIQFPRRWPAHKTVVEECAYELKQDLLRWRRFRAVEAPALRGTFQNAKEFFRYLQGIRPFSVSKQLLDLAL